MASIWGELRRRNVVKVAVAYAIVGWLLIEVASVLLPTFLAPDWVMRVFSFAIIAGFPLAVVLAWAFEITPEGIKAASEVERSQGTSKGAGRKLDFAIIGALVLVLGFVVYNYVLEDEPGGAGVLPNSVAVLLCENLSPNPDDAYFAASIHEEILNQLVKIQELNVIARTSVLQYAHAPLPIPQIAEELNVGAVMECSVSYAGDSIRVTAQLIDPETNSHLWSDAYPGDLSDLSTVFAMQADIAMNIANAVGAEFSVEEQQSIEKVPTGSREAYDYYLRAFSARDNNNFDLADFFLDEAISTDPNFALAYARKAHWNSSYLSTAGFAESDEATALDRLVQTTAERALTLDPTLGIAQAALAVRLYVMTWRGTEAEQAFQRAVELSPNDVDVLGMYGRFKRYRGEFDEATRLLQRAVDLDPNNGMSRAQLNLNFRQSGDWESAAAYYREAANRDPGNIVQIVGYAILEAVRGNHAEAVRQLRIAERLEPNPFRLGQMAHAYSLADRPDEATRLFAQMEQRASENPVDDADWIRAHIAVGDYEAALRKLESALNNRAPTDLATLAGIAANSWADPELETPEFRELLDRLWLD